MPDGEIREGSDDTYWDTDDSAANCTNTTDDGTDLLVDVEREYIYNSDILSSPSSS